MLESRLPEALADKTKVVKLLVDKWFVDKGFGFGKVPSGEVVFIHASAVQGAEVLMIGTEAWVQVVSDDARAQGGFRARRASAWEQERDRERASKAAERAAERVVSEVCTHPPRRQQVTAPSLPEASLSCQNEAPQLQGPVAHERGQSRETSTRSLWPTWWWTSTSRPLAKTESRRASSSRT